MLKVTRVISRVVIPKDTTKIAEPPCQKFDTNNKFGQQQFQPLSPD